MIDVAALAEGDIPRATVTVRTFGASTRDGLGRVTETPTDTVRTLVVHSLSDRRRLERLGLDGRREIIAAYATVGIGLETNRRPPEIQYAGRWYVVVKVADYLAAGGACMVHAELRDETT